MKVAINEISPRNVVKLDKQKGIFNNGLDNAYPQRVERIINNSVTAKAAVEKLASFLIGDGFLDSSLNEIVIHSDVNGKVTLYKLLSQIAHTAAKQHAAATIIQYDANAKKTGVRHEPYRNCRIGKTDDQDYSGFIYVYNNWDRREGETFNFQKAKKYHSYNPTKSVVLSQFENDGKSYIGQCALLLLDDEYIYPLAPIDPALEDADTEAQIKSFTNNEVRKGFFGKWILHHTHFSNAQEYEAFKATMKKFEGGEGNARILMSEAEFDETGEPIKGMNFKLESLQQNINDKLFEYYEKSRANNIRKAIKNIPSILIEQQEASVFGTSGESLAVATDIYNSETKSLRVAISQYLKEVFSNHIEPILANADYEIKPLSFTRSTTQPTTL